MLFVDWDCFIILLFLQKFKKSSTPPPLFVNYHLTLEPSLKSGGGINAFIQKGKSSIFSGSSSNSFGIVGGGVWVACPPKFPSETLAGEGGL